MIHEQVLPREPVAKEGKFISACKKGGSFALSNIAVRYEQDPDPLNRLSYHNSAHSLMVGKNAMRILTSISSVNPAVGPREIALGGFIGHSHDCRIVWKQELCSDGEFPVKRRRRVPVRSELLSLGDTVEYMRKTNREEQEEVFTPDDLQVVTAGIWVTVPDFSNMTVVQPHLDRDTPIVARAVALADIGTAGLEGGAIFLQTSLALFQEDNMDLVEEEFDKLPKRKQHWIRDRIFDWLSGQMQFVTGREKRLEEELGGLSPLEQSVVAELFNKFDDTKRTLAEFITEAHNLPFKALASVIGY